MTLEIIEYSLATPYIEIYDENYPKFAEVIIAFLSKEFPNDSFFHFGSTAIEKCHGKPIIDIFLITDFEKFSSRLSSLESIGFQYPAFRNKPLPSDRPCRVAKVKIHSVGEIHTHIHLTVKDSATLNAAINVVEKFSESKELRDEYVRVKEQAIRNGKNNFTDYSDYKRDSFWKKFDQ